MHINYEKGVNGSSISAWRASLTVAAMGLFLAVMTGYGLYSGVRMSTFYQGLTDAAVRIKLEVTSAHLWFEEVVSGDAMEDVQTVWAHLDRAQAHLATISEADLGVLALSGTTRQIGLAIERVRTLAEERLGRGADAVAGSLLDQGFDEEYRQLQSRVDEMTLQLQQLLQGRLDRFKNSQLLVIVGALLLSLLLGLSVHRFALHRERGYLAQRRSNTRIQEQNRFLSTVLDSLDFPFYVLDTDRLEVRMANKAATIRNKQAGMHCHRLAFGYDRPCPTYGKSCPVIKVMQSCKPYTVEREWMNEQGQARIVALHAHPILDASGRVIQLIEYLEDITERRQAEKALERAKRELESRVEERTQKLSEANRQLELEVAERRRAEAGLRLAAAVFEQTGEGIVITDGNGDVVDVNMAYSAITGYAKEEIRGKNPRLAKSGRHDADFYREMWRKLLSEGYWQGEIWDRKKSGEIYPKWLTINALKDGEGKTINYVGVFSDISKVKRSEERLQRLAYYDSLTELPNRILFRDRLRHDIATAVRHDTRLAVLFLDLDRFKDVNDALGHSYGDQLLIQVSRRLEGCVRESDTVARMGGDEFTLIMTDVGNPANVSTTCEKILRNLQQPFRLGCEEVFVSGSIGVCIYPDDARDIESILKLADAAMYRAKEDGKSRYVFAARSLGDRVAERVFLETNLRSSVRLGELSVFYQPQVDLADGSLVGLEALVRWPHPERGMMGLDQFIPLAEETDLIVHVDQWVLNETCRQAKYWLDVGLLPGTVSVNVSARNFQRKDLVERVMTTLDATGLPPHYLGLELTESLVMQNIEVSEGTINTLSDFGVRVAIADFGTGYTSLSYLKRLPACHLKIDHSFIRDITRDSDCATITKAVVDMAANLSLPVVAQGIETDSQRCHLLGIGCNYGQGYLFGQPASAEEIQAVLNRWSV